MPAERHTFKERTFRCGSCPAEVKALSWSYDPVPTCPSCLTPMTDEQARGKSACVIGDEIDVLIENGPINKDGSPRRYRSRSELNRVCRETGWSNHVEHKPMPGGDTSPHTSRWV
jgi:hypothetical protein